MVKYLKKICRNILYKLGYIKLKDILHYYSQDGEDIVLGAFYEGELKGFYVDIGAHHPIRFSNTQWFYERGWNGINIDATPGSMLDFNEQRKKDTNLECAIADIIGEKDYYLFEEAALNSFDKELSEERVKNGWKLNEIVKIKTFPINMILEKYLPEDKNIDFISLDIEGYELKFLETFNFEKYSPNYFIIEDLEYIKKDMVEYKESLIYKKMKQNGYIVIAKTMRSVIFKKINGTSLNKR